MGPKKPVPKVVPEPEPEVEEDEEEVTPEEVEKAFLEALEEPIKRRTYGLLALQKQWKAQHSEYMKEMAALEKKYAVQLDPLFEKRRAIVTGEEEPSRDEIEAGSKIVEITDEEESKEEKAKPAPSADGVKGIPDFWVIAMRNNPTLEDVITERDMPALKYLQDVQVKLFDDPNEGFALHFQFAENPFFTNTALTKTYRLVEEDGDLLMDKAEGCEIDWKADKNLTVQIVKKKQRKGKQTRVVTTQEPCESFFLFFSPPSLNEDDEDEGSDFEELEQRIEMDYEIGRVLKERIIPHAVDWFTGVAIPKMDFDLDGMWGGGEEGEESDDEGGAPGGAPQGGAGGQECKQQ
jgi:nucleosome assembly protein 1-like 1